uniref:Uncharacterized protein n=1 Tax=Clytia hemisphaerica TaxID=252671 RepID=A0A7M5WI10_9CNID
VQTNASQRRVDKDDPNGKRIVSVAGVYIKSQMAPQAVEYTSDDDTTFTEHIPKTVETVKTDPSCETIANTNLASVEEVTNNTAHAETVVSKHTEIVADTNSNDRNLDADTSKTVSKKSKFLTYFTKIMLRPNNWTPLVIFVMALELATIVISRFLTYLTKIMRRPNNWTPLVMFVMALELATIVMVAQLGTIAVMNLSSTVSSFVFQPEPSWLESILYRAATHCGLAPQPPPSMISQIADYVTGIAGISQ